MGRVSRGSTPFGASTRPRVQSVDEVLAATATRAAQFTGRVWAPIVWREGPLAIFKAPYDAWIDGRFAYCGVDHYILARSEGSWKSSQLTYTVQRENCVPSTLGPPR